MAATAPNIVLVMADQHRADMLGCAGDEGVLTPNLDALASRRRALLARVVPGAAVHAGACVVHDRALRARPRRVHELGRDRRGLADIRVGAARGGLSHGAARQGASLPRRDAPSCARRRPRDRVSSSSASPRCTRPATSSPANDRTATPIISACAACSSAYRQHIADRSYQGDNESGQNATKRVPMWDATPMPVPLDDYIDAWHGDLAVRWIEEYDRAEPFFVVRRVSRPARPVGRAPSRGRPLPRSRRRRCRARRNDRRSKAPAATARCCARSSTSPTPRR